MNLTRNFHVLSLRSYMEPTSSLAVISHGTDGFLNLTAANSLLNLLNTVYTVTDLLEDHIVGQSEPDSPNPKADYPASGNP